MIYPIYDDLDLIPVGEYQAIFNRIDEKSNQYGGYRSVEWEISFPEEYRGLRIYENFNTGSLNETYKAIAGKAFNKFCKQISETGADQCNTDLYLMKSYKLHIDHVEKKNGDKMIRVLKRERVESTPSVIVPNKNFTPTYNPDLNDQIPF